MASDSNSSRIPPQSQDFPQLFQGNLAGKEWAELLEFLAPPLWRSLLLYWLTSDLTGDSKVQALAGKTALITGAGRGIGRFIAERLAGEGAFVIIHYGSSAAAARETLSAIESQGGRGILARADLRDPCVQSVQMFEAIDRDLARKGSEPFLDILVNNAGHLLQATLEETTTEQFDTALTIDLKAPFFVTQAALPRLRDGGRIINISSGTARMATPGAIACAAAKGALNVFTKALAQHLGPRGITVNAVAPGLTATDDLLRMVGSDRAFLESEIARTALGRIGRPADIADVVTFIASENSRWITGQVIDVTGGAGLR